VKPLGAAAHAGPGAKWLAGGLAPPDRRGVAVAQADEEA
jgi:hypothetical protein